MPELAQPSEIDAQTEDRIELLLAELRANASPALFQRVEELVALLVRLYGDVIERLLTLASDAGVLDSRLQARLCADELLSSLLVLHGLHPLSTSERVKGALEAVRAKLGAASAVPELVLELELVGVEPDGVARLRTGQSAASFATAERCVAAVRHAIERAAPEVTALAVDDWVFDLATGRARSSLGRADSE
jgi:hypothetical protein